MPARRTGPAASRLFPLVLVGHKESCVGVTPAVCSSPGGFCPKVGVGAVSFSEIADGWPHLVPAICGMTVLGAMLFIIAVLLS